MGFSGGSDGKVSVCNAGDPGSIPELGRSPGEGNGNPLQCSCLENPMDGGAWWATVHGVTKSLTRLSDFPFHFHWIMNAWISTLLQVVGGGVGCHWISWVGFVGWTRELNSSRNPVCFLQEKGCCPRPEAGLWCVLSSDCQADVQFTELQMAPA